MKRRDAVGASLSALVLPGAAGMLQGQSVGASAGPRVLEWRRYRMRFGPMEARFGEYAQNALLPAFNRAGISPVGAFSVQMGPDAPAVYLLLPHPTADSVVGLGARISGDAEYQKAAASFRALPASDPPYVRREASLLAPFATLPGVEKPTGPAAAPSRVFELRIYESHNEVAGLKKIEMFEKGGEIAIFRRVGLNPVFFARDIVSAAMPALTYLLVFADAAAREKAWATFRDDPEWVKLRALPGYSNAEILTNITSLLLRPTAYSQV